MARYIKDPEAKLDYSVDWAPWLQAGETVTASTWQVPAGLTQTTPSPSFTDTETTIWLTGGTVGETYLVTNHVTTSDTRQDDRSFTIMIVER